MLTLLWRLTSGYRFRPWRSPYLRWRIETYWGIHAGQIKFSAFWKFVGAHWRDLVRYLCWAAKMRRACPARA
jgi:hypothetical protein